MTLTVHLFARLRELAGADAVAVELPPGATVADVRRAVSAAYPAAAALVARSAVAVNHDFAADPAAVAPGVEVAILPPVSGG